MAKISKIKEAALAESQSMGLLELYSLHSNTWMIHRVFCGLYQNATRDLYVEHVTAMMSAWEDRMKQIVAMQISKAQAMQAPGTENPHLHRFRLTHLEAIKLVRETATQQLLDLKPPTPEATAGTSESEGTPP